MIIVDTNVVSELMKAPPHPSVLRWINKQAAASIYTTSITRAEILLGIHFLPAGKRRDALRLAADSLFAEEFAGRVLPFDSAAAPAYASIGAARRKAGRPISTLDAQIAAIALHERATLATRNVHDFDDCGITVIDPWR